MKDPKAKSRDELNACRQWVNELTTDELLGAMEFAFVEDDLGGGSHEYEILKEMLKLQSPLPTPIHPRALSFRPASQQGTDGRDEVDRIFKNRFCRPRLFQLLERESARVMIRRRLNNSPQTAAPPRKFDVVTKRFVTPWGQVLSVGCTAEQREADDILLKTSVVCHKPCKSDGMKVTTLVGCFLLHSTNETRFERSASGILRILHIASRGRFLTVAASPTERKSCITFAPWLDPTQQWFSLPMYLASRFEVALWHAFRHRDSITTSQPTISFPLEYMEDKVGKETLQLFVQRAALRSLVADIIPRDVTNFQIRDSLLWKLLGSSSVGKTGLLFSEKPLLSIWISPLVELDSPVDQMRTSLRNQLQELVAQEMERSLMEGVTSEDNIDEGQQRRRKKKSSKKKRRPAAKDIPTGHDDLMSCPSDEHEELDTNVLEEADEPTPPLRFPNNDTSTRQRTRNIMMCLTILEETVESVYELVGLPKTEPFDTAESSATSKASTILHSNSAHVALPTKPREASQQQSKDTEDSRSGLKSAPVADDPQKATKATRGPDDEEHRKRSRSQSPVKNATMVKVDRPRRVDEDLWSPVESPTNDAGSVKERIVELEIIAHRSPPMEFSWGFFDENAYGNSATRFHSRDRSILEELFLDQERFDSKNGEVLPASSTAASIASSSNKEFEAVDIYDVEGVDKEDLDDHSIVLGVIELSLHGSALNGNVIEEPIIETTQDVDHPETLLSQEQPREQEHSLATDDEEYKRIQGSRSPSPQPPATPSPTLSPVLLSLADLRNLRRSTFSEHNRTPNGRTQPTTLTAGSLPSSPIPPSSNGLTLTWSREDLRISSCRDDLQITGKRRAVHRDVASVSYAKIAAAKTFAKPLAATKRIDPKGMQISQRQGSLDPKASGLGLPPLKRESPEEYCAKSETYVEGQGEVNNWNEAPRTSTSEEVEVNTITRDGSTTITSALSQREEDTGALREERNSYRDLCLTLGSEVAKLRNLLAANKGASIFVPVDFSQSYPIQLNHSGFDPASMRPFFQNTSRGQTLGTMSDAGLHRGDESQVSEDDNHDINGYPKNSGNKRPSSNATPTGSDTSIEPYANSNDPTAETLPLHRDSNETIFANGLHSRLTKDIINFLNATSVQLRKQDAKRRAAFERMTRLVTTLWPRAQVKLYGSHVTGLCLPSSDLDFVICLPAVHKNALAVAPGVLEGRNAINETSQKLLARKMKGESWIDPRSIKTIERTVVPVIKVSTKDTRARMLQLDISFDSPEHHGLEAVDMIRSIMDELPMIRPIVLVLKQFLLDRGLLTAYTGGLSSYCLFLMAARYLQEQPPSWGDCGSLLMGFLDFYGNSFDPRALGISIRRRQYFARPNYAPPRNMLAGQPIWNMNHLQPVTASPVRPDISRRNSFSDRGNVDAVRGVTPASLSRPPRFQPTPTQRFVPHVAHHADQSGMIPGTGVQFDHGRPYTFDPLFVEDPLSPGNNVGRNAFRIFQVQRAFSDAHRALVASLEWDLHSTGELNDAADYPLLKCLLQSEDAFYEL